MCITNCILYSYIPDMFIFTYFIYTYKEKVRESRRVEYTSNSLFSK